eukprot:1149501-Pelagomonas_calceolata.AAC.1
MTLNLLSKHVSCLPASDVWVKSCQSKPQPRAPPLTPSQQPSQPNAATATQRGHHNLMQPPQPEQ